MTEFATAIPGTVVEFAGAFEGKPASLPVTTTSLIEKDGPDRLSPAPTLQLPRSPTCIHRDKNSSSRNYAHRIQAISLGIFLDGGSLPLHSRMNYKSPRLYTIENTVKPAA